MTDCGKTERALAALLVGCWFRLQINYKFIINYEVLPLALPSCGLRKRQNLKSSEPISVLFLASQSHKRFYLQVGDLLFYIPSMYRLISWCSDLWHLNRKDAYEKQGESRRDPNMPPGPRQGKRETTILPQKPTSKRGKSLVPPTAPAASVPQRQPLRRIWQGWGGWCLNVGCPVQAAAPSTALLTAGKRSGQGSVMSHNSFSRQPR